MPQLQVRAAFRRQGRDLAVEIRAGRAPRGPADPPGRRGRLSRARRRQRAGPRLRHRRTRQRDRRGRNAGDWVRHLARNAATAPRQPTRPARSTGSSSIRAGRCCRSAPETFDAVVASSVLEYVDDPIGRAARMPPRTAPRRRRAVYCPEPASPGPLAGVADRAVVAREPVVRIGWPPLASAGRIPDLLADLAAASSRRDGGALPPRGPICSKLGTQAHCTERSPLRLLTLPASHERT